VSSLKSGQAETIDEERREVSIHDGGTSHFARYSVPTPKIVHRANAPPWGSGGRHIAPEIVAKRVLAAPLRHFTPRH
jgi:hypothetical protein